MNETNVVNPVNWKPNSFPKTSDHKYWSTEFDWIQYLNDVNNWWRVFNEMIQINLPDDFPEFDYDEVDHINYVVEYITELEGTINCVLEKIKV